MTHGPAAGCLATRQKCENALALRSVTMSVTNIFLDKLDQRTSDAGRVACAQLVEAVSSSTSAPLRKAVVGCALARLHKLIEDGFLLIEVLPSFEDFCATVSALVEVYSFSLRELATPKPSGAGEEQRDKNDNKGSYHTEAHTCDASGCGQRPGSSIARANSGAAGHGAGSCPEDWVPLLVDSSALVASCLPMAFPHIRPASIASMSQANLMQLFIDASSCGAALVSTLLRSDALPALTRLLSAEAQRGPARALLNPRQLATCLLPLNELLNTAHKLHMAELPDSSQQLRLAARNFQTTATGTTTTTAPTPSPMPSTPASVSTASSSVPSGADPSAASPAAASSDQAQASTSTPHAAARETGGSAAVPLPQGHDDRTPNTSSPAAPEPQRLGAAVLTAVAESGVVEATCRVAVGALEQGPGEQQQQQQQQQAAAACVPRGDREQLMLQLLELTRKLRDLVQLATAGSLPREPLRTILSGPCVQYALAAHSVSQLHAVDGGTTYSLPYDSLLLPVLEEEGPALSCKGALDALQWWTRTCATGCLQLSPRGLFGLCLRKAEVAAHCWRRRNEMPAAAAAAAAGGPGRDSGSGGSSSSGRAASSMRQPVQDEAALHLDEQDTGCQAARLCHTGGAAVTAGGGSGSPPADPPRATLAPSQCPELAMQAVVCSRVLMESSCKAAGGGARAGARVLKGTSSGAGGSGGTDRIASSIGNTAVGKEAEGPGGGSVDGSGCGARAGGSGDEPQGSSKQGPHTEAEGSAGVGVSGSGREGQGCGADTGDSSGRCGDAAGAARSSGSGSGEKRPAAWLCHGGPLARRWWRAAVAAVHCAVDELEGGGSGSGSRVAASSVHQVLDLSLAMPVSDTGPDLPAFPPPALAAALDAGYLPCLERTLRTCFRMRTTPAEAMDVCGGLFCEAICKGLFCGAMDTAWPLLLAFGDETEAAALLATATKVARRACEERARPGGDRKACGAAMVWLNAVTSSVWRAADHIALRVAAERGFRDTGNAPPWPSPVSVQEQRGQTLVGSGGSSGGGGDGVGGSSSCPGGVSGSSTSDHGCSSGGGNTGDGNGSGTGAWACGGAGGVLRSGGACSHARSSGGGGGGGGEHGRDSGSGGCANGLVRRSSLGGGGGMDGDMAPPTSGTAAGPVGTTPAAAAAAGSLSPPEQQLLRLLSFALPLWVPLWLDLVSAMVTDGRLIRCWRGAADRAFDLLDFVQYMCMDAVEKEDLREAESWRGIIGKSGEEVEKVLRGCRRVLEREEATVGLLSLGGRGVWSREDDGVIAEKLYQKFEEVRETAFVLDANLQDAISARGEVEGGWEGLWPLVGLGLLAPPCDARQVLACCSNPRCVELAGDSEAGVVLRRCGGACGGAVGYCCAACQRAHWAAGHREECRRGRGGEKEGVAGTGTRG